MFLVDFKTDDNNIGACLLLLNTLFSLVSGGISHDLLNIFQEILHKIWNYSGNNRKFMLLYMFVKIEQ